MIEVEFYCFLIYYIKIITEKKNDDFSFRSSMEIVGVRDAGTSFSQTVRNYSSIKISFVRRQNVGPTDFHFDLFVSSLFFRRFFLFLSNGKFESNGKQEPVV